MLDKPEKTRALLAALKAAQPFDAGFTPAALALLRARQLDIDLTARQTVSEVSYAGDEGGILCHIVPHGPKNAIIISLTHLRIPASLPFAPAVADYQKHRIKKLKKQCNI